tara:strand:+ start:168 stop:416 length:249 start_codon:yes stop_codon:yes gene_type:complete
MAAIDHDRRRTRRAQGIDGPQCPVAFIICDLDTDQIEAATLLTIMMFDKSSIIIVRLSISPVEISAIINCVGYYFSPQRRFN